MNKSIDLCSQHYQLNKQDFVIGREFDRQGAVISVSTTQNNASQCLLMIGSVFQLLSDVLYKRYREDKRFVLQTRCSVASAVEAMQLDALQASERLTHHLIAKEMALYLNNEQLKHVGDCYQLVPMPNPTSVLTRHAFMINGMNESCAELAQQIRTEILKGKSQPSTEPDLKDQAS